MCQTDSDLYMLDRKEDIGLDLTEKINCWPGEEGLPKAEIFITSIDCFSHSTLSYSSNLHLHRSILFSV